MTRYHTHDAERCHCLRDSRALPERRSGRGRTQAALFILTRAGKVSEAATVSYTAFNRSSVMMGLHMHRQSTFVLLIHAMVLLVTCTVLSAEPPALAEAEKHVRAGISYRDDPSGKKLEEAYREFHAAYALVPSQLVLMNIGYCAHRLERDAEAIDAYKQFLENASPTDLTPQERKQMQADIQKLQAELVTVSVQTVPNSVSVVDERLSNDGTSVINRYSVKAGRAVLGVRPGKHRITFTAEGYVPQTWEFEALPASQHAREFRLTSAGVAPNASTLREPTTPQASFAGPSHEKGVESRPIPESVYLGAAITGVFVIGTTATGILALSKKGDFDELNADGKRKEEASSARKEALRYATFSNIGLAGAVISAGVTGYLYFTRGTRKSLKDESPSHARATWQLSPVLTTNQAALQVSGAF